MLETVYIVLGFNHLESWLVGIFRTEPEADMAMDLARTKQNPDKPAPTFYVTNIEIGKYHEEHHVLLSPTQRPCPIAEIDCAAKLS